MDFKELFHGEESFIKVAENFYNKNFGTMSKSEIDLLMFAILFRKLKNINKDGNDPSDLELAKILGITSQKVRNMREKMEFKFQAETEQPWEERFAQLFKTPAFYSVNDKEEVYVFIKDVMLRCEVENFLRANYFPTEYTLNKEVLLLRKPAFCALVYACCSDEERALILGKMEEETDKDEKEIKESIPIFD